MVLHSKFQCFGFSLFSFFSNIFCYENFNSKLLLLSLVFYEDLLLYCTLNTLTKILNACFRNKPTKQTLLTEWAWCFCPLIFQIFNFSLFSFFSFVSLLPIFQWKILFQFLSMFTRICYYILPIVFL